MIPATKTHSRTTHRAARSLRSAAKLGLGLLSLLMSAGHSYAAPVTWNGPTGTDWFATQPGTNTTYWSNGSTPGAGDDAQNNTAAAMTLGQDTTINSFFSSGAFTLQGGTFSGNQASSLSTIQVNNVFTDNGGQINNFTVNRGQGGSLVFTNSGGNSLLNTIINSSMDLTTHADAFLNINGTNTVNGQISLGTTGNGLRIQDGNANLILGKTGSLVGFGSVFQGGGNATLTNNGLINANSLGTALALSNDNFNNTGTAEATNGGALTLATNTTTNNSGLLSVTNGGIIYISGTLNSSASSLINSVGGRVNVFGANLNGTINETAGSTLVLDNNGKNFNSTTVNGNLDMTTNLNAYANIVGVNTFNGVTSLGTTGNGLRLQDGNTNLINNGSLVGFGSIYQGGGNATLTNNGTINANGIGQTLAISSDNFNNTGTAEAAVGGILTLASNTTTNNSGLLAATSGGVVDISGTFNSNAGNSINSVGGTINVFGANLNGTINETAGSTLVLDNSGKNFNSTTVNGNLDMTTNLNAYANIVGVNTFNGVTSLGTTGNGLHLQDGNTNLILGSGGSLVGFGSVYQGGGQATLTNNGTVEATGGTLAIGNDNFNNTGTAEAAKSGILTLASNTVTTNTGTLAAINGGILDISGTLNSSANSLINGVGGTVNVFGANLNGTINETAGSTLVLDNNGKNFNSTTVNGNLDMATNLNAYANIVGVNTFNGVTSLGTTGNGLHLQDGNTNLINNGSLVGFGSIYQGGGNATLTNNGTINANSSGNTLAISSDNFTNTGTAEATNGGILTLATNTTTNNGGLLSVANGGVVDISGTFNSNSGNSINSVGGTVNVFGANVYGTINETAGSTLVLDNSGKNFHGTTVNGNLDMATNTASFVNFDGINTVNGQISLGTSSNGLRLQDGNANLVLGSGGSLVGFGSVFQGGGNATLTNNGLINATGGTLAISNDNFANTRTAEATNGGTLSFATNTSTTNSGALSALGTGSLISIAGTFTSTGSNLITAMNGGQVQMGAANVYGTINEASGTALVLDNSGKNFHSTTVNGNLDMATNTAAYVNFDGVNTVNGQISLGTTGNGLRLQDGNANLVLGSGGSLVGFGSVFQGGGQATLTNNGLINANGIGQTLAISNDNFNNTGTVQVQNGATLTTAGNTTTTDSGNILVKTGGTATFGNPLTQTAGLTQVDGTLNSPLALTGGTLAGTGTVVGNVANNGGTVSAGNAASPFGTLAVNGTFSQGTAGIFDVGFSSTQNNLLAVNGAVTTGGFLSVNYLGSGPFTAGNAPFTFLNYGSLTSSINGSGPTQYFSNEMFDSMGNGLIAGQNGFTYELLNNTNIDGLQLEVLQNGAPTPAVPEASTTISMGLLLLLGGGGLVIAKRRRTASAV